MAAVTIDLALQSGNYPQPTTPAERKEFIELIRTVPPVTDYDGPIKDGYRRGMIAGTMLREVVAGAELRPGTAKLTAIKRRIASNFTRERISVSTINNSIWPRYRCVAAYWGAYISMGSPARDIPIPCRPADLGVFLAMADDFRRRAEATHTPQSPEKTLLRQGETVAIPPAIRLPAGKVRFAIT